MLYNVGPSRLSSLFQHFVTGGRDHSHILCNGIVMSRSVARLFRHLHPQHFLSLWQPLLASLANIDVNTIDPIAMSCLLEIFSYALSHSDGRGLSNLAVKQEIGDNVIQVAIRLISSLSSTSISGPMKKCLRNIMARVWIEFPSCCVETTDTLQLILKSEPNAVLELSKLLINDLSADVISSCLLPIVVDFIASRLNDDLSTHLPMIIEILVGLRDCRSRAVIDNNIDKEQYWREGLDVDVFFSKCQTSLESITKVCLKYSLDYLVGEGSADVAVMSLYYLRWISCACPQLFLSNDDSVVHRSYLELNLVILSILTEKNKIVKLMSRKSGLVVLSHGIVFLVTNVKNIREELPEKIEETIIRSVVMNIYLSTGPSIAISWAVSEVVNILYPNKESYPLSSILSSEEQDSVLNIIGTNLITPSYWLRINNLNILRYFSPPHLLRQESDKDRIVKEVNISQVCFDAAICPVGIGFEREFKRLIGILEVLVRGDRLNTTYLHIICGFCLGLLSVKFKSFWESLLLVIGAAADSIDRENILWPLLQQKIGEVQEVDHNLEPIQDYSVSIIISSFWIEELDNGQLPIDSLVSGSCFFIYSKQDVEENVFVESDARTDKETLYETVWSLFVRSPIITLRRSKVVIPYFLR